MFLFDSLRNFIGMMHRFNCNYIKLYILKTMKNGQIKDQSRIFGNTFC